MAKRLKSLWMTLLLASVTMMLLQPQEVEGIGPTGVIDLKTQVMTKCKAFLGNSNSDPNPNTRCERFWEKFTSAFVNKDPQKVTPEAYNDLIKAEPIEVEKDKALLWSKTKDMVTFLSNLKEKHFFHIGETIFSIMDEAVWCGKNNNNDVLTSGCPNYTVEVNPVKSYWKRVSQAFAGEAKGKVTVLLSGTADTPFDNNSIFAADELPNLKMEVMLQVILINKEREKTTEKKCDNKSLKDLEAEWVKSGHTPDKYRCKHTQESYLKNLESPETWWDKIE